jgi:phage protein U
MSSKLMMFGPHIWHVPQPGMETPNFETINIDSSFNVPSQGRLTRDPAIQFTGPGEEVILVEGRLFPHIFGGIATLDGLRKTGREGKPHILMRFRPIDDGYEGEPLGKFMIRRLRQNHQKIGYTGIAHKIDFTLELVAYGDDKIGDTEGTPDLFT